MTRFFLGRDQLIRTHTTLLQIDFDREKTTISLIQPYFSSLIFLPGRTREPWRFLIYASISASTGVFNLSYLFATNTGVLRTIINPSCPYQTKLLWRLETPPLTKLTMGPFFPFLFSLLSPAGLAFPNNNNNLRTTVSLVDCH